MRANFETGSKRRERKRPGLCERRQCDLLGIGQHGDLWSVIVVPARRPRDAVQDRGGVMNKITMLTLATYLATFPFFAYSAAPAVVECDAGRWAGVSMHAFGDSAMKPEPDGVELPYTIYTIDHSSGSATMFDGTRQTNARVVHSYGNYVVISYVFGNVHYTDTLYLNGMVVSQLAKTILFEPATSTFYKTCSVRQ